MQRVREYNKLAVNNNFLYFRVLTLGKSEALALQTLLFHQRAKIWKKKKKRNCMLTFTSTNNFKSAINLTCICSDCGRKPDNLEGTHPNMQEKNIHLIMYFNSSEVLSLSLL